MSSRYEPKDHIQPLLLAPRVESILDQREITIHSYQTTVPFDFESVNDALEGAWLTPHIRFGIFARIPSTPGEALNVVLGLQDEVTIRAYDYDERRPLWYSWQDVIVDTVNLQYSRDEDGLLRFTTAGGGRRITDDLLHGFNAAFLGIPKLAVSKRHFDLEKLRRLCFTRFADRLYMIRFSDPSGKEYRSIDHAMFQSRKYIDPNVERLKEIRGDPKVRVESFDSDIEVITEDLAKLISVRFFIRGLSGSLRLRFPKVTYKKQLKSPEEQASVFFRLAEATVSAVLDEDYYAHGPRSLDDLSLDLGMFPDMVDLVPFREVLVRREARKAFFLALELGEQWPKWAPHLQAIDELLASDVIAADVKTNVVELVRRESTMAVRLLTECQGDPKKQRVGRVVAEAIAAELQAIPAEARGQAEETLLSWAIDQELNSWDVDADRDECQVLNVRWRIDDFAFDVLPIILWKLVAVLHSRLKKSNDDIGPLLRKFQWCIEAARNIPKHHSKSCAALRLVATGRIPRTVTEAAGVLKGPFTGLREMDDAVLDQFGLPTWPHLTVTRQDGIVAVSNNGIGVAISLVVYPSGHAPPNSGESSAIDLHSGESISLPMSNTVASLDIYFEKFGQFRRLSLPIAPGATTEESSQHIRRLQAIISPKRLKDQRAYRKQIDPDETVIGASPALLLLFEQVRHANLMEGPPPVLLLGEPGVGKTHIAKLIHDSSVRKSGPFLAVNAGGGGGDVNIQRGEWIGVGKGHGIAGIDSKGRPGHLMNAEGGTLFVDEFGALSQDLQVNFLSVLENRSIQRVGGESFIPDVRCIFATNADVAKEIEKGFLRRGLLDRILVMIQVPPLRDRRSDILLLAKHFANGQKLDERCMVALLRYDWPANIRELQGAVASAIARMRSDGTTVLKVDHFQLPEEIVSGVNKLSDDACHREVWVLADEMARLEGFEQGTGLQRRAGEIVGVGEAQASKVYAACGLARAASA